MHARFWAEGVWVVAALALAGCGGAIAPPPTPPHMPPPADPPEPPAPPPPTVIPDAGPPPAAPDPTCRAGASPGPSPLRRLTNSEYENTVRDLLGDEGRAGALLPAEELGNGFGNDAASQAIARLHVERYLEAAQQIAARATTPERLAALLPCDPLPPTDTAGEDACARAFIERFGARAQRRPLSAGATEPLQTLFTAVRGEEGFVAGIRAVLEALLQSPAFLYRLEEPPADPAPGARPLDGYQRAARLSYLLWGSMPDSDLFEAARTGALDSVAGVRAQAQRLLASPRARPVVRWFFSQLLGFKVSLEEKSPVVFPRLSSRPAELSAQLTEESERFVEHVVFDGAGDLRALLTAPYSFWNETLATFYGEGAASGPGWQQVALAPERRAGVLTQAAVLASRTPGTLTNPTRRGVFVRRLLCAPIPEPPQGFDIIPPPPNPGFTTRELFAAHASNPGCAPCHKLLDPIGAAFETFDAIGLWRDQENGRPVDATGQIADTDVAGPFDGAVELAGKLAGSADLQRCFVGNWFTFAHGRAETEQDRGTRAALEAELARSSGNVRALLLALTQTDAFLCAGGETP
jgi:hypothetical protein